MRLTFEMRVAIVYMITLVVGVLAALALLRLLGALFEILMRYSHLKDRYLIGVLGRHRLRQLLGVRGRLEEELEMRYIASVVSLVGWMRKTLLRPASVLSEDADLSAFGYVRHYSCMWEKVFCWDGERLIIHAWYMSRRYLMITRVERETVTGLWCVQITAGTLASAIVDIEANGLSRSYLIRIPREEKDRLMTPVLRERIIMSDEEKGFSCIVDEHLFSEMRLPL